MTSQIHDFEIVLKDLEHTRVGDFLCFSKRFPLHKDFLQIPHKFLTENLELKIALADQDLIADYNFFGPWYSVEAPITAIIEFENGQLWATKDTSPKNPNAVYVRIYPWQDDF